MRTLSPCSLAASDSRGREQRSSPKLYSSRHEWVRSRASTASATIDATGEVYGIRGLRVWSTVTGTKVMNASPLNPANNQLADGIPTIALGATGPVAADYVSILRNEVAGNLGSGIDINSSSYSTASFNWPGALLGVDVRRPSWIGDLTTEGLDGDGFGIGAPATGGVQIVHLVGDRALARVDPASGEVRRHYPGGVARKCDRGVGLSSVAVGSRRRRGWLARM